MAPKVETFEKKFLTEFVLRLIKSQAIRDEFKRKKAKLITPELPSTGPVISPVIVSDETKKTPELMRSIINEQPEQPSAPRVLLTPPKVPMGNSPMHYAQPSLSKLARTGPQAPPVNPTQSAPASTLFTLEKITKILSNPSVNMLECPGSGKPLVITAGGRISTSNMTLTDEEINQFMNEVSQKTRIPLISGLFKAVVGNYLIIAVISEIAGTRFVIQKR